MSNVSRKDFLRLSSWGVIASLIPFQNLHAITSSDSNPLIGEENFKKAQELAKQAKVFFYKKQYAQAENLYMQCINLAPAAIRFYDNLDNVFGAQSKIFESVILYKSGLDKNPKNVAFYDRAARSLMRVELSSKKVALKYKASIKSDSLLQDAKVLFEKAIKLDASKTYLTIGLNKINHKINTNALSIDFKKDKENKAIHKANKSKVKSELNSTSDDKLIKRISDIDTKKRTELFHKKEISQREYHKNKEKKKIYRLLLSRNILDSTKELNYSKIIFDLDHSDSLSINKLKSSYYKNSKFSEFIDEKRKFALAKNTLYSYIGLMHAIFIAHQKKVASPENIDEAIKMGENLLINWSLTETTLVDVVDKLSRFYIIKGDFIKAKTIAENTLKKLNISTPFIVNKAIFCYANIYFHENKFSEAKNIVLTGLKEINETEVLFSDINIMVKNKINEKEQDKKALRQFLYSIYFKLNEVSNAKNILLKLEQQNPTDKFVLKRK